MVAKFAEDLCCSKPSIQAVANTNASAINLETVIHANIVLQAGLEIVMNITSGAEAMEVCLLYHNSVFHKRAMVRTNKTITIDWGDDD